MTDGMRATRVRLDELPGEVLTVREVAAVLGLARNTTYEAVERGEIPSLRIGRRRLVPREALRTLIANAGRA